MGFKRFSIFLSVRVCVIMGVLILITWLFFLPGYQATLLMSAGILIALIVETLRFINKTNAELVRFLEAVRHGELTQRFDFKQYGTGFEQLGQTFNDILQRLQQDREEQEQALRYLKALVEQVPVPLISLHLDGKLTLWNHSARRLFGSHNVNKLADLSQFNPVLPEQLDKLKPGQRQLARFENDGMAHQLALSATQILIAGKQEKLISLQDIRSELDVAQLQAWQDLVRVLTHEIMNSITPVASLANTASDLVGDVIRENSFDEQVNEQLNDLQDAVQRLSRRSNGLMHFVSSYRRLTRLPEPKLSKVDVRTLFDTSANLVSQGWSDKGIELSVDIEFEPLFIQVDASMIEQVLINLLQNAEQALANTQQPKVRLFAYLNRRNRGVIKIEDNGPGIPQDIIDRVFIPFFTTKREGSGVGLALTRQIMIAHGGSVKVENGSQNGARFTLTF